VATPTGLNNKTATIETGTRVRSLNPLYGSHGVGRVQKVRDEICKVEFNPGVFSTPPHRSINYLLKIPELEVCPTPPSRTGGTTRLR